GDLGSTAGPIVALPLVDLIGFRVGYLVCVGLVVLTGILVVGTLFGSPVEPMSQTEKGRCQQ
ncbi:MAG: hypothetical protein SV377_01055, partial [Halobacteria archaeon]|nr:hypothetical protein [Halobacteria archaeon]